MDYEGFIIRPPSEAYSLLLQVTTGCSHNKCTFCGTYRQKKFKIKPLEQITKDLAEARHYEDVQRVFLCDGDALIIPQPRLEEILELINQSLPDIERIGTYANAKSILRKSIEELKKLKALGLSMIYLGLETGNNELLKEIHKGVTYEQMVAAGCRVKEAGMTLSVTVLLGLGGIEKSIQHALDTAKILTDIDPDYVGALTVMFVPETELYEDYLAGRFVLPDTFGFIRELYLMIEKSHFTDCYFTSNHASNYLSIKARLPHEKENILKTIGSVIHEKDFSQIRPEYLRGL
ncbi:MAG TPA: radical SAM protein [Smithella sp.]|nr:radical SAM protein [Smithella sp.]HOU50038.1 radical SAM protein [Smithella sp.]HQG64960.1 radical SAM protein [Smithella sp.]HQI72086.1 radical SAM protein [Smithella sp.]